MRNLVLFLALAVLPAFGSDAQFNGRWDITVPNARHRAWWLEVDGAGTQNVRGKFVGFPGGDMNEIENLSLQKGVLRFTFDRPARNGREAIHQVYTARLLGNKLEGTFESGSTKLRWVGVRAPKILDKDDGSWKEGRPIELFDHKDFNGWRGVTSSDEHGWTVKNGILTCIGHADNLETVRNFWNFLLHVEFRIPPNGNSGIGLRGRYEVQVQDDYGKPLERHMNGAVYSRITPTANASKPAGEWQTYDIRLVGRTVTVVLNGQTVIDKKIIEGLTAIAIDPNEGKPGPIVLQGDHRPVEYRSVVLTPLVRHSGSSHRATHTSASR